MNPGRNCLFSDGGKLGIRRDHPHRRIEMEICVVGGLQEIVLIGISSKPTGVFGAVGWKFALSH